jgi:preprotein translocase subunit SecG
MNMVIALKIILVASSLVLIATVLLQQGNSAGLSGAIGGGAEQLFGKKKSRGWERMFVWVTIIAAIAFIVSSLGLVAIE